MSIVAIIDELEAAGASLRLDGQKVRVWFPDEERRQALAEQFCALRAQKEEVTAFLRTRGVSPGMPSGVRLVHWNLKEPPVVIDTCSVVADPALFARPL